MWFGKAHRRPLHPRRRALRRKGHFLTSLLTALRDRVCIYRDIHAKQLLRSCRILRAPSSMSVLSDGTGPVDVEPVGVKGEDGKIKRVKVLTAEQQQQIKATFRGSRVPISNVITPTPVWKARNPNLKNPILRSQDCKDGNHAVFGRYAATCNDMISFWAFGHWALRLSFLWCSGPGFGVGVRGLRS